MRRTFSPFFLVVTTTLVVTLLFLRCLSPSSVESSSSIPISFGWMASVRDPFWSEFTLNHHNVYKASHVYLAYQRKIMLQLRKVNKGADGDASSYYWTNFFSRNDTTPIKMQRPNDELYSIIARYNYGTLSFDWIVGIDSGFSNGNSGMRTTVFPLLNNCNDSETSADVNNQNLLGSIVVFSGCTNHFPQFDIQLTQQELNSVFRYTVVVRLDNSGQIVWHKMIRNGNEPDYDFSTTSVHVSSCDSKDGNTPGAIYLAGSLMQQKRISDSMNCSSVVQPPEYDDSYEYDEFVYVLKLSAVDGSCLWVRVVSNATITAMSSDDENLYVAGSTHHEARFYQAPTSFKYFSQNLTLGNVNDCYYMTINASTGSFKRGISVYGEYEYSPTSIVASFAENRLIMSLNIRNSLKAFYPRMDNVLIFEFVKTPIEGESAINWARYALNANISTWAERDGGVGGISVDLLSDGSSYLSTTCRETFTFNRERRFCKSGYGLLLVKYDKELTLVDILEVDSPDGVSDIGLSIGVDDFALSAGYSSGGEAVGSYDRVLSSEFSFDFLAQVVPHPPRICFGINKYNTSVCSGHGPCVDDDTCSCKPGYFGDQCQHQGCNNVVATDPNVCNSHGRCQLNGTCTCLSGYSGENCDQFAVSIKQLSYNKIGSYENLFPISKTLIFSATIESGYKTGDPPVTIECTWKLMNESDPNQIFFKQTSEETIQSRSEVKQFVVPSGILVAGRNYSAHLAIQPHNIPVSYHAMSSKVEIIGPPTIDFSVTPTKGIMSIDHFLLSTSAQIVPASSPITYRFGYLDQEGSTKFLNSRSSSTKLNTTLPLYGNQVTLLVRASNIFGDSEKKLFVTVDPVPSTQATAVLTEQLDTISELSGEELELQLSTYTTSLISSIDVIPSNQSSQLINSLLDVVMTKQEGLSTESQLSAVKAISGQYRLLSENSTIQTSMLLVNSLNRPDTNIDTSISVARNLANVMLSGNSTGAQKSTFTSVVNVLTNKVRQNMTDGETTQISMPYLETVIAKLDPSTVAPDSNTTIAIRQPSSSDKVSRASNREVIEVSLNNNALKQLGASYVQGQVASTASEPYADRCDTTSVSPTISTLLFTPDQKLIDRLDNTETTMTPITQSAMTLPVKPDLTDEYRYVCKYFNVDNKQWLNDTNVCKTDVVDIDGEQVQVVCECMKPSVTQTVSLDYIQSASETNNNREEACTNPCGCKSMRKKGLEGYKVALIVLGLLTFVLLLTVLIVSIVILSKVIYNRVEKQKADNPARGLNGTFRELTTFE